MVVGRQRRWPQGNLLSIASQLGGWTDGGEGEGEPSKNGCGKGTMHGSGKRKEGGKFAFHFMVQGQDASEGMEGM